MYNTNNNQYLNYIPTWSTSSTTTSGWNSSNGTAWSYPGRRTSELQRWFGQANEQPKKPVFHKIDENELMDVLQEK